MTFGNPTREISVAVPEESEREGGLNEVPTVGDLDIGNLEVPILKETVNTQSAQTLEVKFDLNAADVDFGDD